ncbi:MAG: hypothetical protein AAFX99_26450 [Myxococcota bacterium]
MWCFTTSCSTTSSIQTGQSPHAWRLHLMVGVLALVLMASACSSPEDQVRARLEAFNQAALWRDPEALYQLHLDSQGKGVMCDPRFRDLFAKAAAGRTPETCTEAAQVVSATPEARAKLDETIVLMSEILHFQCQHPDSTCNAFSRNLFFRRARTSPLLTREIRQIDIASIFIRTGQDDTATAYLAVHFADRDTPERITLELAKQNGRWWVTTYPW